MNRTKDIIVDAFWQLLDEKPISQITVKDIVTRCQVNRNTFYYHFHDIPELFAYSIKQDVDTVMQNSSHFDSLADCLTPIIQYSLGKKRAILHIYRSVEREVFLQLLERLTLYVLGIYVDAVTADKAMTDDDRAFLTRLYKSLFIGLALDWFDHSMDYDLTEAFSRASRLFSDFDLERYF